MLVHSAIQYLGQPVGGVGMYYTAFYRALDLRIRLNPDDPGRAHWPCPPLISPLPAASPSTRSHPLRRDGRLCEYVRQRPEALPHACTPCSLWR